MNKKLIITGLFFALAIALFTLNSYAGEKAQNASYKNVETLEMVENPQKYLNTTVEFTAKFDKFSILGLDYPEAMRSSEKYLGFTVQRDDTENHNIPLSELKLFLKQQDAEKYAELECGDIIKVQGKVFSTALNDPWLDVEKITIVKKVKEKK